LIKLEIKSNASKAFKHRQDKQLLIIH